MSDMKYGAVAAGHEETARVAMEVLKAGGNATDALIASYVASFVAEPCMGSPGGGALALVFEKDREAVLFDFFCQTPLVKKPAATYDFLPYTVHFGDDTEVFYYGNGAAATPGAVAGIFSMHKHSGRIPVKELFEPGINLMRSGVPINDFQQYDISLLKGIIGHSKTGSELLLDENGDAPTVGTVVSLPGLANFMEVLAIEGPREFYEGYYAKVQQKLFDEEGGSLSREDLKSYEVKLRKPLGFKARDFSIMCAPPPALGGAVMAAAVEDLMSGEGHFDFFSPEYLKRFFKAFSFARKLQSDPGKLANWMEGQMNRKWGSTSHISIMDAEGNCAALTTTIGEGNGHFDPLCQIHMNNMLGESALLPGGYHSWTPDTRMSSMMNPVIIAGKEGQRAVLGSGGAGRIPYALTCVIWNLLVAGMPLKEAVDKKRLHLDDRYFHLENTQPSDAFNGFHKPAKFWKKHSLFFGGVHAVLKKEGSSAEAVGDFRREGFGLVE
jgi:gamma-glutamyltranspeptidase / glutathione hydrolase